MQCRIPVLATGLCLAALAAPLASQTVRPFPLTVADDQGDFVDLSPIPELMQDLRGLTEVVLVDIPLPGNTTLDLVLQRVDIAPAGMDVRVDGISRTDIADPELTLWSGKTVGGVGDAFLAFSPYGTRGWIRTADELYHLLPVPAAGNDWSRSTARWVTESFVLSLGLSADFTCALDDVGNQPAPVARPPAPVPSAGSGSDSGADGAPVLPLYEARIALETDFQFYETFGDLGAAQAYAFALIGAASERYREQIGTIITVPYVMFYTQNNDPWTFQDTGGNCIDVLYQFVDDWDQGAAPVNADLYTMFSTANLGCGVAYLDVLCNQDFGFSVEGNLSTVTPIPIIPFNPFNWDFMVTCHELGHNFSSPHTHDYCPPIDECYPGTCSAGDGCVTNGTIMSYCHLCDGGFENITTFFDPTVVAVMRTAVENSCLALFEGVLAEDLGGALTGSTTPDLVVGYTQGPDTVDLVLTDAPANAAGALFFSNTLAAVPFKGGTLFPAADFALSVLVPPSGDLTISTPITTSFPNGVELVTQVWFADGGGFSSTNGVAFELITP